MRVAFLANQFLDPQRPTSWSGLPFFIKRALEDSGIDTLLISCRDRHRIECWTRFFYWRLFHKKRYLRHCNKILLQSYARQIEKYIASGPPVDAVFSVSTWLLAFLRTRLPSVLYTDACFGAMLDFYESFSNLAPPSIADGHHVEQLALTRCTRVVYSSPWAADAAHEFYDIDPSKVDIVFYGAGFHESPTVEEIAHSIRTRDLTHCKLLLVGVDWLRKGIDVAVQTVTALQSLGCDSTLTIVGCKPPDSRRLPKCVKVIPFIDKGTAEGRRQLNDLYKQSHFFILPSRAEASGVVFSEACAFGLPCLATNVGGIPSVIINDVNGQLFGLAADGRAYAEYLHFLIKNPQHYRTLATRSLRESVTRLSWKASGPKLAGILQQIAQPSSVSNFTEKATIKSS